MLRGALTQNLDVAQVVLYAFWIFFAGLVFYLRREDRREGYPLENDKTGKPFIGGFPFIPEPKTFRLAGGGVVLAPNGQRDTRPVAAARIAPHAGAPLEPTGNPLTDGVGPAAWAERADLFDLTSHGTPRIVPLRAAHGFSVADEDPDPRGFDVVGCDRKVAGVVTDIWVDQSEQLARYFEVAVGTRTVLLPVTFSQVDVRHGRIYVHALQSTQFAGVPGLRNPDTVTRLEEEKICGYYGGGTLYATAQRAEPLL